jgi:basic amino acid/polyamine antiporter, APA family
MVILLRLLGPVTQGNHMSEGPAVSDLRRTLGSKDVALLTIGSVIGSGIFFVPGEVLKSAGGSLTLAFVTWIFGGLLALAGALTFAEIGARRPEAGGLYVFIRDAFGRAPAFLFGWSTILAVASGTVATLAVAFGDTIQRLFDLTPVMTKAVAVGALVFVAALNLGNAHITALLQSVSGTAKAVVLLAAAAIIAMIGPAQSVNVLPAPANLSANFTMLVTALVAVLWAYEGWHNTTYCAGEMKNPDRVLPRGLVLGVLGLILIYLAVNLACAYALGAAGLIVSGQPVADALAAVGQEGLARFVRIFVAFSILGAAHATFFSNSRVVYAMAKDGLFFDAFAKVNERTHTPQRAVLAIAACGIVLTVLNAFGALLSLVVVSSWFFVGLAGASIFVFRKREGLAAGHFSVPFYPILPALFILSAIIIVGSSWISGPVTARYGLVVMIIGWIVFAAWERIKIKQTSAEVS